MVSYLTNWKFMAAAVIAGFLSIYIVRKDVMGIGRFFA